MKKILFIITFIALLASYQANAQAYVKFAEVPVMELKAAKQFYSYSIAYKALDKSTIYLELKHEDVLVGNSVYDITRAGEKKVILNVTVFNNIKVLEEGSNYSYTLYMYEGGRNDWTKQACKTVVVENVRMINRNNKKSISVNTFD